MKMGRMQKKILIRFFVVEKVDEEFFLLFIFLGGGDNENKLKLTKAVGFGLYLPLIRTR